MIISLYQKVLRKGKIVNIVKPKKLQKGDCIGIIAPCGVFKDSDRLIITPHIAWASVEARTNLMNIIHGQIKEYLNK